MRTTFCCQLRNKIPFSSLKHAKKYFKLKPTTTICANQSVTLSNSSPKSWLTTSTSVARGLKILSTRLKTSLITIKFHPCTSKTLLFHTLSLLFTSKSVWKKSLGESHSFTIPKKFKRQFCFPELTWRVNQDLTPKIKTFITTKSWN